MKPKKLDTITIEVYNKIYFDDFYQLFYTTLTTYLEYSINEGEYLIRNFYTKEIVSSDKFHKLNEVLIAKDNSKIVGFIIANISFCGVSNFSWMGIIPEYRKLGIGTKLMNEMENKVVENSHLIEFSTVYKNLSFYKKLGYKVIGIRRNGYFNKKHYILNKEILKNHKASKKTLWFRLFSHKELR